MATQGPTLDGDLGWALGVLFRRYVKAVDAVVGDIPGGPRGYQVLALAARATDDEQAARLVADEREARPVADAQAADRSAADAWEAGRQAIGRQAIGRQAIGRRAIGQRAIGERLGIDRTVLTYLIDDLERLGLVERRPDPADRRGRLIFATTKGADVGARRCEALRHVEEHLLAGLGDDAPRFRDLVFRLATEAQSEDPVTDTCQVLEDLGESGSSSPPASRSSR